MPALPSLGLALLGSCNLAGHLDAIRNTPGLEAVGCWGASLPGLPRFDDPASLLHHPLVKGAVVCTQANESEYWAREAVRAGRQVLCAVLPTPSYQRLRQLAEEGRGAGVGVCLLPRLSLPPGWAGGPGEGIAYFSLRASVPQSLLRGTREGVLACWGAECLQVLADRYGPLDSVYARSRSLGLNRPEEDMSSAQLRFRKGTEGLVFLNGLGSQSEVWLEEWGCENHLVHRLDWRLEETAELAGCYREFCTLLAGGPMPAFQLDRRLEGLRWAEWFQQSARLDREIHADEVVHG